ncbi:MAG TPA: nitroreductase family protein [Ktedonobacterales bacterium]|nr:nitroreductase family protein [Ktedonobacterales bacterium]
MEVFETIRTVLAVRQFRNQPIPESVVHQIVEAGRLTASAANKQPWHFVVVQNAETLRQLGALARTGPYIPQAPLAIVVAVDQGNPLAVSDASRAMQDMIITAWSQGVGSNWVGFKGLQAVNALLGIPDTLDVLAIMPCGYPAQALGKGEKKRKPLGEVAHREQWGQPFA